jgi:hypothetical protein
MKIQRHHGHMDPIAFVIAKDYQRRVLEGAQPPRRRTRRRPIAKRR